MSNSNFLNEPTRRPGGITLLAVLIVISGILGLLASVVLIVVSVTDVDISTNFNVGDSTILILGIVEAIVALVYLAVARGLMHGSGLARGLTTVVSVLSLAAGIYGFFFHNGNLRWSSLGSAILAAFVLILLYSPKANEFFRSHAR